MLRAWQLLTVRWHCCADAVLSCPGSEGLARFVTSGGRPRAENTWSGDRLSELPSEVHFEELAGPSVSGSVRSTAVSGQHPDARRLTLPTGPTWMRACPRRVPADNAEVSSVFARVRPTAVEEPRLMAWTLRYATVLSIAVRRPRSDPVSGPHTGGRSDRLDDLAGMARFVDGASFGPKSRLGESI